VKHQDGLLHGLTCPLGPIGLTGFWRSFFGTGAGASEVRVSEWIINISTILGYTVPFTLVHAEIYRTEDKLEIQKIQKLNINHKKTKQTAQNTAKQN